MKTPNVELQAQAGRDNYASAGAEAFSPHKSLQTRLMTGGAEKEEEEEHATCCRICLMEGDDEESGRLVKPCKCSGSIAHVHVSCLRQWIRTRLAIDEQVPSFVYRQTSCELCKTAYPLRIDGEALVQLPQPSTPFVALDVLERSRQSALHVLPVSGEHPHGIGRTTGCAVRIYEASISRCHATVRCSEDGEFLLADNNSKFGTLLAVRRPVKLEAGSVMCFQAGSTVLTLMPLLPSAAEECSSE